MKGRDHDHPLAITLRQVTGEIKKATHKEFQLINTTVGFTLDVGQLLYCVLDVPLQSYIRWRLNIFRIMISLHII